MSIAPYGYTLTVWTSGAVLTHARGVPTTEAALFFMIGAVLGFALVALLAFGSLHQRVTGEATQPRVWVGLHVLPISLSIGAATLVAHLLESIAAWPLGGFAATVIYLAMLSGQLALAG
jgi:hypothetical protein